MSEAMALPEAVRGCWYFVPADFEFDGGLKRDREVLAFGVDGTFRRYTIEDRRRRRAEAGDYNFDGDFLILRGRKTRTFRVGRSTFWRWELEEKNDSFQLARGFVDGADLDELDARVCRDIRLLPRRARIESDFDGEDVIYRVVYDGQEGQRRQLGSLSAQRDDDDRLWVGVTPLVRGLESEVWQQIVRESFVDTHLDVAGEGSGVTIHRFDNDETMTW